MTAVMVTLGTSLADMLVLPIITAIGLAESALEKMGNKNYGIADSLRAKYKAGMGRVAAQQVGGQTALANSMTALAGKWSKLTGVSPFGRGRGPEDYAEEQPTAGAGAGTGTMPEPVATTGILSGFAAKYAAAFGFNRSDPKKEEKEMVGLLGKIVDAGPLVVQPGG